jgi:hypothetical protein
MIRKARMPAIRPETIHRIMGKTEPPEITMPRTTPSTRGMAKPAAIHQTEFGS